LQTSYASGYGTTSCVPNTGGQYDSRSNGNDEMCSFYGPLDVSRCGPDGFDLVDCVDIGEPVAEFNCDKTFLCNNGYCDCEGGSCSARRSDDRLRLRRVGEELIGVFDHAVFKNARGLNVPLGEVRFHRE